MDHSYVSLDATAIACGVHIQTIYQWIKKGKLRTYQPMGKRTAHMVPRGHMEELARQAALERAAKDD